jgi:hypothetical protein
MGKRTTTFSELIAQQLSLGFCYGNMKGVKKQNLPEKICKTCGRPFSWRKKWERCWDEVQYCSEGCKKHKIKR